MVSNTEETGDTSNQQSSLIQYSLTSDDYLDQFVPFIKSELRTKDGLDDLIERLEKTADEKQTVLESLSFDSVGDLTNSIDTIEKISKSAHDLSKDLAQLNKELGRTGKTLVEQKHNTLRYKKLYSKITDAYVTINSCLELLEKTNRVLELIQSKQFYKALINLDQISRTDPEELKDFDFSIRMYSSIPTFRRLIVEETYNQLIKWLNVGLERNLSNVGEILFDNYKALNDDWIKRQRRDPNLFTFKVNSPIERTLRDEKFRDFDPLENNLIQLDLSPVYQAVLVYQSVNQLDKLKEDCSNEILRRRDRLIYPIREALSDTADGDSLTNPESLRILLYSIAALFVSDRYISEKTQQHLRTTKQVNDLYDSIVSKLVPLLRKFTEKNIDTPAKALELADTLGTFVQVSENWNFDSQRLYEVMMDLFALYIKLSVEQFRQDYKQLSLNDDSQPIEVANQEQMEKVMSQCFFQFEDTDLSFPKSLPFSVVYPGACLKLRSLIRNIYSFLERYYRKRLDRISQMVAGAIDEVLVNIILKDLDNKVHSTYKEEVSQNLINLEFFSNSVLEIEKYLNYSSEPLIAKTRPVTTLIKLKAQDAYKNTRRTAEEGMFEMVDSKVEMLFEMVDFDWSTDEVSDEPSMGIKDMGLYLENMFRMDFSHLPYSTRTLLLIRSFDKIVTYLKNSILNADSISEAGVANFETDVKYIESLLPNMRIGSGSRNFESSEDEKANRTLQTMFVSLEQIVDLLKEGSLDGYRDESIRQTRYSSIKPDEAHELIGKLELTLPDTSADGTDDPDTSLASTESKSMFSGLKRQATTASFSGFSFRK